MSFNIAVSGLRAANSDLNVIGNNIANASTTGFKSSRAEFADVYASSAFNSSSNTSGSGVLLKNISQSFNQGNVSFTNNDLDLALNGNGFFVMSNNGAQQYSRAGIFGVDNEGFIVDGSGKFLQGFQAASASGAIGGSLSNLQIQQTNMDPQQTTATTMVLNLDATELEPAERGTTIFTGGASIGIARPGIANSYPSEILTLTLADNSTRTLTTLADASASEIAADLNLLPNVNATASTTATLSNIADNGGLEVTVNGVTVISSTGVGSIDPQDVAIAINNLSNTTLRGISATFDAIAGTVTVTSNRGDDLEFNVTNNGDPLDSFTVQGITAHSVVLQGNGLGDGDNDGNGVADGTANDGFNSTIGGRLDITLDENVTLTSVLNDGVATDDGSGIFAQDISAARFVNNAFDPTDEDTYNHATSLTVYDSLGTSHILTAFFVKEAAVNTWSTYLQIDNQNIGEPNPALDPPLNTEPTLLGYSLVFNDDGSLNQAASDEIQITYWTPLDAAGNPNGAATGQTFTQGAIFPVVEPFTTSNFDIDMAAVTQYGSPFSVIDALQNGYTTGRPSGLDIGANGEIYNRFTNGQSVLLGQVALARFVNQQGLQPAGETAWVETFDSGIPVIGTPGTSAFGVIQSGALEESNVDLSQELVALILAQRNYQANAQTIQTEDSVTQTIINLR
ncbi:MAG: flagellar hook-basal body complex protein [Pseudomonadota bacterium]